MLANFEVTEHTFVVKLKLKSFNYIKTILSPVDKTNIKAYQRCRQRAVKIRSTS